MNINEVTEKINEANAGKNIINGYKACIRHINKEGLSTLYFIDDKEIKSLFGDNEIPHDIRITKCKICGEYKIITLNK